MELEELEMISNKVKFGIVIIGLLGGLFLVLHYVIYPNLATGETRYLLWSPYSKPYSLPCLSQLYWVACWFGHLPKR